MCHSIWGKRLVLQKWAPLLGGGDEKHLDMGEIFVARRPLVPLLTIIREHACVKNDLVGVFNYMFAKVRSGSGTGVRD